MDRQTAETYLEKKGQLVEAGDSVTVETQKKITEAEAEAINEKKIQKVMKEGKIYGDPVAKVQW